MVYTSFYRVDGDTLIKTRVKVVAENQEILDDFMNQQRDDHNIEEVFTDPDFGGVCILPEDFKY